MGATLGFGAWRQWTFLPPSVRLFPVGLGALAALVVALVRPAGRDLTAWAFVTLRYAALPKKAVWHPQEPTAAAQRAGVGASASPDDGEPGGWIDWLPYLTWAPRGSMVTSATHAARTAARGAPLAEGWA